MENFKCNREIVPYVGNSNTPSNYSRRNTDETESCATTNTSDTPPCQFASTQEELAALFGNYFTDLSRCDNIFLAIETGRWPTAGLIVLKDIPFKIPLGEIRALPENAHLFFGKGDKTERCILTQGTLKFSRGELVGTTKDATPYAIGPEAKAYTIAQDGHAYSANRGSAHATFGGCAFALGDRARAYANGKGTRAYGMEIGSIVHATDGATAFKHIEGIKITKDSQSQASWTAVHLNEPAHMNSNGRYTNEFIAYITDLGHLAKAGDGAAQFKLGMVHNSTLRNLFNEFENPKVRFLESAYKSNIKEAAFELGEYYMQRDVFTKKEDREKALKWYKIARDENGDVNVQEKIEKIEAQLQSDEKSQSENCIIC
jgi:hypothetical protein